MRLNFYEDPGHGWLAVPLPLLERLGLLDSISPYSYMRGLLAHLEEDCDASLFIKAAREAGIVLTFREHNCPHKYSRIRNYCQFNAVEARRVLANSRK
jgi:hypothetical protein